MTKTIEELLEMQKFLNWNRALEKPLVEIGFEYEVFKQAQALLSQGEPVCTVIESKEPMKGLSLAILNSDIKVGTNLYLAPPSKI